jgi:hypothetical protein
MHGIEFAIAAAQAMAQRATAHQPEHESNLRDVIAIEPDAAQAAVLEAKIAGHSGFRLRVMASTEAAMTTFVEAIPDLILVSPLLPAGDEEQIMSHLYSLGVDASSVQLLPIARFIAEQLDDPLDALRLEHIEHLLGPLDADEASERSTAEIISFEPLSKREIDMPTTTHDQYVDTTGDTGTSRLPRFLTPDDRIPLPLRALLDEADGCLKMAFLTGAGACAVRTLDLLLAEQGVDGTDRGEQIQQLGKKHPAVGESFITTLALVTNNNPSGAWEDARVRLALAILKAMAYEIYVLGPERSERAAYVLELLKKFKAAGR